MNFSIIALAAILFAVFLQVSHVIKFAYRQEFSKMILYHAAIGMIMLIEQ